MQSDICYGKRKESFLKNHRPVKNNFIHFRRRNKL